MKMHGRTKMLWHFALPSLLVAACVVQPAPAVAQMTSVGIDCSQIQSLGLMKQENMRAGKALIECGILEGGHPVLGAEHMAPAPPNVLASNRSCTGPTACTKSESSAWASTKNNGKTVVVNYNDHNSNPVDQYSGTSYSIDGGKTFKEILPPPFRSDHGENYGDPIVVFNSKLNLWFGGDLVAACGGQGVGLWTSKNGKTWTAGACAHNGGGDDRESFWVDNEPSSGTYGRMYISWNDFDNNGGALSLVYSDDGKTWSSPVVLNPGFIRDVQVTGTPRGTARYEGNNSTVFVAAMDEGSGGCDTRQNVMYKSLDGGKTWTSTTLGARFASICQSTCGYFAVVNPIWRHMGWGEPGVGPNGVVHYVYAGAGASNNDPGDIYYVRSTDNGETWSTPVKLNTDNDNTYTTQWMPSLSVNKKGDVTASWYDRRKATSACSNITDKGCNYERVGRQSSDNGNSFLSEITISSKVIKEPAQEDGGVVSCYAGDYDYSTALNGNAYITWTDGRVAVGGVHVQNVEFAKVPEPK